LRAENQFCLACFSRLQALRPAGYTARMSVTELKSELDRLSPEELRHITAYLLIRERMQDPEFREEMARKIDDNDPSHWITLEEAEKRLLG
jgi:hypothetical protein